MSYGESIAMLGLPWAKLHFVENEGMAFGLKLGGDYGKLILSMFRLIAVGFLVYYINRLLKEKAPLSLLICFGLILAGALGNIIDSAFYGLIFSASEFHHAPGQVAQLFPPEGGYAGFLHGKVVDMLYFPLIENKILPDWVPFWGGNRFTFFKPVFNIADASITIGVLSILLFQRSYLSSANAEEDAIVAEENEEIAITDTTSPSEIDDSGNSSPSLS